MREISEHYRSHLAETLLGRLKLKLFERITGTDLHLPEPPQVRHFVVDQIRSNKDMGMTFSFLLNTSDTALARFDALQKPQDIKTLLGSLESSPLEEPFFLELTDCPEPLPNRLGAFVYWSNLVDGGLVYVVTLFDEVATFPAIVGRAEIRASQAAPEPAFSVLREAGWEIFSQEHYEQDALVSLFARILVFVEQNQRKSLVPLSEVHKASFKETQALKPPHDSRLQVLLGLVLGGKMRCAEAEVQLSLIKPYDMDFLLSYPLDVVDQLAHKIRIESPNHIIVYWREGKLVMSDDYALYLAYRKLGYEKVPVVIIGPFPRGVAVPSRIGGADLLPPIRISHESSYRSLSPELKEFILDNRLHWKPPSEAVLGLYRFIVELATLLQDPNTRERQLHELLRENPVALDAYGLRIQTEVRLGDEYRIDLVILSGFTDKRVLLIELERSDLPIFTKKGRPRAEVTHAVQQVEDWLRWIRETPSGRPNGLDGSVPMEGLVVIGRSADMSEDDKRRLLSLNDDRRVPVITYDDLLDRVKNLIMQLE